RLCGTVHTNHFNAGQELVDADAFSFTVAADTPALLHITGTGLASSDLVLVELRRGNSLRLAIVEGDHGTLSAELAAGTYTVAVAALNPTALTTPFDYAVTIVTDNPDTRCPPATGGTTYAEANDGAGHD